MNTWRRFGILSAYGSCLAAFLFIISLYYSLPESDGAKQQGLFLTLLDPLILTFAFFVASVVAAIYWPVSAILLRKKEIKKSIIIIAATTAITIIFITPINPMYGFLASVISSLTAILACYAFLPNQTK